MIEDSGFGKSKGNKRTADLLKEKISLATKVRPPPISSLLTMMTGLENRSICAAKIHVEISSF